MDENGALAEHLNYSAEWKNRFGVGFVCAFFKYERSRRQENHKIVFVFHIFISFFLAGITIGNNIAPGIKNMNSTTGTFCI